MFLSSIVCFLFDLYLFIGSVEQDEGLEKLEETVLSTKHIALAVNEELDLHTRLIVCNIMIRVLSKSIFFITLAVTINCVFGLMQDDLDEHVDITDTRLQVLSFFLFISLFDLNESNGTTISPKRSTYFLLLLLFPFEQNFIL